MTTEGVPEKEPLKQPSRERETFGSFITIVGPVFYNRKLSSNAKLLYGLLSAMSQAPKYYAFAYNETMQTYLECSERALQRYLKELSDAGEITIIDGQGGRKTLRKIYLTRVQPFNPDRSDGVNPDKNDGVTNIYCKNKQKEKGKGKAAADADAIEWLDAWATKQEWEHSADADPEAVIALIKDLHAFAENRAAKKKPILTVRAASLVTGRLIAYTKDMRPQIPAMRYILQESINHNWEKLYPIKPENRDDFKRWCADNYDGLQVQFPSDGNTEETEYF